MPELLTFKAIGLCDSVQVFQDKVRPILYKQERDSDLFTIKIRTITNCAFDNLIGAFAQKEDTLNLLFTLKGEPIKGKGVKYQMDRKVETDGIIEMALCDCYAQLEYRFKIENLPDVLVLHSKKLYHPKEIYPIIEPSYEMFNGEIVNRIDSIGNQQGRWIFRNDKGQVDYEEYFSDDESISTKYVEYYENGKIKREVTISDKTQTLEFHPNEYLLTQCTEETLWFDLLSDLYKEKRARMWVEIETCFEYNEKGEVVEKTVTEK
ncbi:MAG: hypothetical protein RJQ14_02890 [Marinoscillum sp.]